jgi:hypothetical protein
MKPEAALDDVERRSVGTGTLQCLPCGRLFDVTMSSRYLVTIGA